ncbi:NADPH oxidase activator 1 isoform X2 [Protopterus annectens]|uniref:NADPH oxidase activator 1 isoform X2 n=1 Tax=Protopterus annectens TaxID=7888 RepID=UPI001CFC29EC|nr:NADPH oxidase activator 1 isoform X2 [Protopterus annectens]
MSGCILTVSTMGTIQRHQAFDRTIAKDEHLAIGFFQRGVAHLQAKKYEEALSDCRLALVHLRGNIIIDYGQLGLAHKLYAWEALYNRATVQCHLGLWTEATESLQEAIKVRADTRPRCLDGVLEKVKNHILLEPLQLPEGRVFRPRKQEVEQLKQMDFLGKSWVVSSVLPDDDFVGFEPLRHQTPGFYEPRADGVQGRESGYYTVLYNYFPKNSSELQVLAGGIVYVLDKGEDGWAIVIHDGQKGLLPSSHLDTKKHIKVDNLKPQALINGIPLPPKIVPPSRPNTKLNKKLSHPSTEREDPLESCDPSVMEKRTLFASEGSLSSSEDLVTVKIHYTFTVAVRVNPNISVADLQNLINYKFKDHRGQLQISFKDAESNDLVPVTKEDDLKRAWQQTRNTRLTLWCKNIEAAAGWPTLYQMTAVHGYTAQGPEDLEFNQGDTVDIISEVNEEWLEGYCKGNIGIFPKCFAIRTNDTHTVKEKNTTETNS